ncbi:MAG TPA: hypothetical protein VMV10_23090 [Pirellulales bacterium]|nr:hypothetical protein [Pirellulales bacterium]
MKLRIVAEAESEILAAREFYRRALLSTFRYVVVFELESDAITVIAIAHASRAPGYWTGRHG